MFPGSRLRAPSRSPESPARVLALSGAQFSTCRCKELGFSFPVLQVTGDSLCFSFRSSPTRRTSTVAASSRTACPPSWWSPQRARWRAGSSGGPPRSSWSRRMSRTTVKRQRKTTRSNRVPVDSFGGHSRRHLSLNCVLSHCDGRRE